MNIVLDILALVIFSLSIFFGYKKGFVKTVLNLCGGIICLIVAIALSPATGNFISTNYVTPTVENIVSEKMTALATTEENGQPDIDKLVEEEPNEFLQVLENFNIDYDAFKEKFEEFKISGIQSTTDATVEYIAKPLSETISYIVAFILLLIVSSLIIALLTFLLDKIVKLPLLRTANKLLGVIAGILFGLMWIYVLAMIVEITLPYIQNSTVPFISGTKPMNTLIFRHFYDYNPIHEIIKALLY